MDETDFSGRGERRRLKAAGVLIFIYVCVSILHLRPWGQQVVWGLLLLLGIHSVWLLLAPKLTLSTTEPAMAEPAELPFISLLVAAKNEEAVIANLVKGLCQLNYQIDRWELWVIDDHSSDRTPEILEELKLKYPQLKTLRRGADAKGGKSGALNQVLPMTQGEIIGVFDADAQVSEDLLQVIVPMFQRPKIGAIQLRKSIANAATNFWTKGQSTEMALDLWFQDRRIRVGGIGELRGNGQFVRRSALLSCGGWNEETITDDLDLTLRLHLNQWDIGCLAHPAVQEEGVVTWKQLWHQRNRWAEGGYQRYLDYWPLIVRNRMNRSKTIDLYMFLFIQFIVPTATVPDLLWSIGLKHPPLLSPLVGLTMVLSIIGMVFGSSRYNRASLQAVVAQTLRCSLYMIHWVPVIASVTFRMSIRPKQLKWVKTIHQGIGDSLLSDDEMEMIEQEP